MSKAPGRTTHPLATQNNPVPQTLLIELLFASPCDREKHVDSYLQRDPLATHNES